MVLEGGQKEGFGLVMRKHHFYVVVDNDSLAGYALVVTMRSWQEANERRWPAEVRAEVTLLGISTSMMNNFCH